MPRETIVEVESTAERHNILLFTDARGVAWTDSQGVAWGVETGIPEAEPHFLWTDSVGTAWVDSRGVAWSPRGVPAVEPEADPHFLWTDSQGVAWTDRRGIAWSPRRGREINEVVGDPLTLVNLLKIQFAASEVDTSTFERGFEYEGRSGFLVYQLKWYTSLSAWQMGTPEADADSAPIIVEWIPEVPLDTLGKHKGVVRYRLPAGTTGDVLFFGDIAII